MLVEQPGLGISRAAGKLRGVRRFHIERIRYWVYFRVHGEQLQVLSIWHTSRGSGPSV